MKFLQSAPVVLMITSEVIVTCAQLNATTGDSVDVSKRFLTGASTKHSTEVTLLWWASAWDSIRVAENL